MTQDKEKRYINYKMKGVSTFFFDLKLYFTREKECE